MWIPLPGPSGRSPLGVFRGGPDTGLHKEVEGVSAVGFETEEYQPTRWERVVETTRVVVVNLLFTALFIVVLTGTFIIYRHKRREAAFKRHEVIVAQAQLNKDLAINAELKGEIRFLETDAGVEKIARNELGLIRPNETTYMVVNRPTPPRVPHHKAPPPRPTHSFAPLRWTKHAVKAIWNWAD